MLEKIILLQRAKQDMRLANALRMNLTTVFYTTLKQRATTNKNVIISWYGGQGYGKSLGAFFVSSKWSEYSSSAFEASNVTFTEDELMLLFGKKEHKTIYVKDEQVQTFGLGSEREEAALENVAAVVRAQQLSLIYCSPSLKLHNVHFILEATGIINEARGLAMHILYEGSTEKPIGFIFTKLPILPQEFWSEYTRRKNNYINMVRMQQPTDRTAEYRRIAEDFLENHIKAKSMKFGSKKALRTALEEEYKLNYTRDEWIAINNILDNKFRETEYVPYTFPNY